MGQQASSQAPTHFDLNRVGNEAYMIVPPDGGWGWVIIICSFIGFVIFDGISFSFTLFRHDIAASLQTSTTNVAAAGSLFSGLYFASGIFACAIGNRYGFQKIMLIGATVLVFSFLFTGLITNIYQMYFIFGVMGGFGGGFLMISFIIPPGFYFDKKRPLSMGLSCSGTGFGAMSMPYLLEYCIQKFGWRNTFFIKSGIVSVFFFIAFLMRPLDPIKVLMRSSKEIFRGSSRDSEDESFMMLFDNSSLFSNSITADSRVLRETTYDTTILEMGENARKTIAVENVSPKILNRLQRATLVKGRPTTGSITTIRTTRPLDSTITLVQRPARTRRQTFGARPLYRTDIMYTGSLIRLSTYTEKETEIGYHLDVTRPATQKDIDEEIQKKFICCPEAIRRGFSALINVKFLKSLPFLCFAFCGFFTYFSFHIPFFYITEKLKSRGMQGYKDLLCTVMGLGLAVGRILSGIILITYPLFGALTFLTFSCFIAGLSAIAISWHDNIGYQAVLMATYGFTVGVFLPLRSVIIVDFMGLDKLTSATGMIIIFQGFGSLLGLPTANFLKENFQDFNAPFYVAGVALILNGLILVLMKVLLKKRRDSIQRSFETL